VKLNRRELRRLIESVINEANPGSKFAAAEKKGEKNKSAVEKDTRNATREMQKTYDWYINTVFPSIEENDFPIVADDTYYHSVAMGDDSNLLFPIKKGTKINDLNDTPYVRRSSSLINTLLPSFVEDALNLGTIKAYTLGDLYQMLEFTVIKDDLRVTMQSEQPDEFEEAVANATVKLPSHDEIKALGKAGKDNAPTAPVNESLSRGSLYRRRYHGRY